MGASSTTTRAMRDASTSNVRAYIDYARAQGLDVECLFEGLPVTRAEVGRGPALLASAQGIIAQARGKIFLDSGTGRGTTLHIYLPRSTKLARGPADREAAPAEGKGERVLLVDDQDTLRNLFAQGLERLGFAVVSAASGPEALTRLRELDHPVDVLVTDVVMPEMGGREVAERVRHLCPGLPVVFVSGYSEHGLPHTDDEVAPARFLPKPFTATQLAAEIRAALVASRGPRPPKHSSFQGS